MAVFVERGFMSYFFRRIPVLCTVLVFVFSLAGCKDRRVVELQQQEPSMAKETEGALSAETVSQDVLPKAEVQDIPEEKEGAECVVHVCGAVNRPGVYCLPAGSRIHDAVEEAKGLREDAAESSVNQAAFLEDGMQIRIPTLEEAQTMTADQTGEDTKDGLVDLNSASVSELMTLPGIGQTRVEAILSYRERNGRFRTIEDIMKVDGIKEASFQKLQAYITVR